VAAGSPFLQLANTILKLAELDDRSRGAVMLSRTMQQNESERAGIPVKGVPAQTGELLREVNPLCV
jgi:hypothetical protein